ncbi:MAG TPA: hypothetical protein VFD33_01205 [Bacillota bacterium]|nr:hypothetical protein [Bacillota bacterium]
MLVAEKHAYLETMEQEFPRPRPRIKQPETKKQQKPEATPSAKPNTLNKVKALLVVAICFAMACLVVFRYAGINENHINILELEAKLAGTLDDQDRLRVELAYNQDMKNVEFNALDSLGMYYPEKDQVRYVDLPKADQPLKAELVEEPKESFWNRILGFLN